MTKGKYHVDTQVLHGGWAPDKETGATAPPIYQTTSYAYQTAEELENVFAGRAPGDVYSRISNPTVRGFESRMTALENGVGAVACSSGMAAISTTVLALVQSGDEILSGSSIFGGTYTLFNTVLRRQNINTRFVPSTDAAAYREAISERTKLIFVETIGNPKMDVPDITAIAEVAREQGVVLVVDNTVTTPVLFRPAEMGADIVIHSASKFINGHGNALAGVIIDTGNFDWSNERYPQVTPFHQRFKSFAFLALLRNQVFQDLGCCPAPFNAFLMSAGLDSLAVRMDRHCRNAEAIAQALDSSHHVTELRYPGIKRHPQYEVACKQFGDKFGALLAIRLGSKQKCFQFINSLTLAQNLANLGDAKTLVVHPASTFCRDATESEREAMGVTEDLVRLAVGLENADDLINDICQSLDTL